MSHSYEQVGNESDNRERDVGIEDEEVEVEEADDDGEGLWADDVGNESDDTDRDEEVEVGHEEEACPRASYQRTQKKLNISLRDQIYPISRIYKYENYGLNQLIP